MKLKYCCSDLKPPKALLEAVKVPDPLTVEQFVSKDPDLVWADHLFLAACRVPGYNGHGGHIPKSEKAEPDRCQVVSLLVKNGADPTMRNKRKVSPLHMSCRFGLHQLATHLIRLGAEVDAQDEVKETPLYRAVNLGYEACVEVLLAADADPNVQNRKGYSPLHRAVVRSKLTIVPLLLDAGAHPGLLDRFGKIPADYSRNQAISSLLEEPPELFNG